MSLPTCCQCRHDDRHPPVGLSPPLGTLLFHQVRNHIATQLERDHQPDGQDHQGRDDEGQEGGAPHPLHLKYRVQSKLLSSRVRPYIIIGEGTSMFCFKCFQPLISLTGAPHWNCREKGEEPTERDGNFDVFVGCFVIFDGELESQEAVQVDEDEVVDGCGAHDDLHAGHDVTQRQTESPPEGKVWRESSNDAIPGDHVGVDGDHAADYQVYHRKRDYHQAESLHRTITTIQGLHDKPVCEISEKL